MMNSAANCGNCWMNERKQLNEEQLNEELRMKNEEFSGMQGGSSFGGEADILHSSLKK